jgi:choline dehydrogenase-like flavoprotein
MFNILVSPTSRGSVTLSSSNPLDNLVINPNFLSTELDRETMFSCLKLTNQALTGSMGQSYGIEEFGMEEGTLNDMSTEAINQRIQKTIFTPFHPSGTCAMGTVVDAECKVLGVTGLRVVDASIFPFPLAAHYQAAVYAIAEQVSSSSRCR